MATQEISIFEAMTRMPRARQSPATPIEHWFLRLGRAVIRVGLVILLVSIAKEWLLSPQLEFPYRSELGLLAIALTPFLAFKWQSSVRDAISLAFVLLVGVFTLPNIDSQQIIALLLTIAVVECFKGSLKVAVGASLSCILVAANYSDRHVSVPWLAMDAVSEIGVVVLLIFFAERKSTSIARLLIFSILCVGSLCLLRSVTSVPFDVLGGGLENSAALFTQSAQPLGVGPELALMAILVGSAIRLVQHKTIDLPHRSSLYAVSGLTALSFSLVGDPRTLSSGLPASLIIAVVAGSILARSPRQSDIKAGDWSLPVFHWRKMLILSSPLWVAVLVVVVAQRQAQVRLDWWMSAKAHSRYQLLAPQDVSESLRTCVVAAEDNSFYRHHGFDFVALHRALRKDLASRRMVEGGSTISMQAVRYAFDLTDRSVPRKFQEAILTSALEGKYTKEQILDIYLTTANFGFGQVGANAAAKFYFRTNAASLTLAQSIYLASAVNHPPNSEIEFARTLEHRDVVAARVEAFISKSDSADEITLAGRMPASELFRASGLSRNTVLELARSKSRDSGLSK